MVAQIEAVTESADPRKALVSLTLELELDSADEQSGGLQLAGLSMKELRDRTKVAGATAI